MKRRVFLWSSLLAIDAFLVWGFAASVLVEGTFAGEPIYVKVIFFSSVPGAALLYLFRPNTRVLSESAVAPLDERRGSRSRAKLSKAFRNWKAGRLRKARSGRARKGPKWHRIPLLPRYGMRKIDDR